MTQPRPGRLRPQAPRPAPRLGSHAPRSSHSTVAPALASRPAGPDHRIVRLAGVGPVATLTRTARPALTAATDRRRSARPAAASADGSGSEDRRAGDRRPSSRRRRVDAGSRGSSGGQRQPRARADRTALSRLAGPSQCSSTQSVDRSPARKPGCRPRIGGTAASSGSPPISVSSRARPRRSIAATRSAGVDHELGDQRVVVRRDALAGLDRGVDPDARTGRHAPSDRPGRRSGRSRGLGPRRRSGPRSRGRSASPPARPRPGPRPRQRPRRPPARTARGRCRGRSPARSRRARPGAGC